MATELLLGFGESDLELGDEVRTGLERAGYRITSIGSTLARPPAPGPGGSALALLLVTRSWTHADGLNRMVEELAADGVRAWLVWWDEDAPSDDLSEHAGDDEVFYACFLPRDQRVAALVERLRGEAG
jgi:hypothetical protein